MPDTYYLHGESGSDLNNGTSIELAKRTLDAALGISFGSGDTLRIKGGYLYETSSTVTIDSPMVIRAWEDDIPGSEPVIACKGGSQWTLDPGAGEAITIMNLTFDGSDLDGEYDLQDDGSQVWVPNNCVAIDVDMSADVTAGTVAIINCNFNMGEDPNRLDSDVGYPAIGANRKIGVRRVDSPEDAGSSLLVVASCSFYGCYRGIESWEWVKESNKFFYNIFCMSGNHSDETAAAITIHRATGATGDVAILINNYFYGCGNILTSQMYNAGQTADPWVVVSVYNVDEHGSYGGDDNEGVWYANDMTHDLNSGHWTVASGWVQTHPDYASNHDGSNEAPVLADADGAFPVPNILLGERLENTDDGSYGTIISNTANTITTNTSSDIQIIYGGTGAGTASVHSSQSGLVDNQVVEIKGSAEGYNGTYTITIDGSLDADWYQITSPDHGAEFGYSQNPYLRSEQPLKGGAENLWTNGDAYQVTDLIHSLEKIACGNGTAYGLIKTSDVSYTYDYGIYWVDDQELSGHEYRVGVKILEPLSGGEIRVKMLDDSQAVLRTIMTLTDVMEPGWHYVNFTSTLDDHYLAFVPQLAAQTMKIIDVKINRFNGSMWPGWNVDDKYFVVPETTPLHVAARYGSYGWYMPSEEVPTSPLPAPLNGTPYTVEMDRVDSQAGYIQPLYHRRTGGEWIAGPTPYGYSKYDVYNIKMDTTDFFFILWDDRSTGTVFGNTSSPTTTVSLPLTGNKVIYLYAISRENLPTPKEGDEMTAGKHDIIIEQGSSFKRTFIWKDSAGDPVNITGYSAAMMIKNRKSDASGAAIFNKTNANGEIDLGGANGTITINIAGGDTASMDFDWAYWDIELTSGADITRLLEGKVRLSKEVTAA